MPENEVKVKCHRDQTWSFGRLKKDQIVTVAEHIGISMVECGYGEFVYDGPDTDKALTDDGLEKKIIEDPVSENKTEEFSESTENKTEEDKSTAKEDKKINNKAKRKGE